MKKITLLIVILMFIAASANRASAITISGTPPTTGIGAIDTEITNNWPTFLTQVNSAIGQYGQMNQIAMAMSNANAYSSSSSTLQGYQGYKIWAATVGLMTGIQLYSYDINELRNLMKALSDDGDIYLGMGIGASLNVGLHIGHFASALDGLYVNFKFMYLPAIPISLGNIGRITPSNLTIGGGINYQLIKRKNWVGGLFEWGGLSIGSGVIYNNNDMRLEINQLGTINTDLSGQGTLSVSPNVDFMIKNNTFTVPVDLITSIKLLWFLNITAGVGADFNFGWTTININSVNEIRVKDNTGTDATQTPGQLNLTVNPNQPPAWLTPKVMLGVGFKIWAIVIDVPVTFYFPIHANVPMSQSGIGVNVGLTVGAVW